MAILYKYDRCERILSGMKFVAADPTTFNDPFEVRPYFDQERHNQFAQGHESFYERLGVPHSLIKGGSMASVPTENAAGFAEDLNRQFREYELRRRFRVLCLCKTPSSALMWGHHADSHKGLVVGVETGCAGFAHGLEPAGFEISYAKTREGVKLPLAYYQTPSVESYDVHGNIANNPNELVKSDGGIDIPFSEYRRQVEQTALRAIQTKSLDWSHEQEIRFIYRFPEHSRDLQFENNLHFVPIPPAALREIIFGFQTPFPAVERVVELLKAGKLGEPKLFFAECHPYLYEVQRHEAKADYLIGYYKHVVPSRRRP